MKKALPLFLLCWLFIVFSCKQDDFEPEKHNHGKSEKRQISFREFQNLEGHKPGVQRIKKYFRGAKPEILAKGEDITSWEIDTARVIKIITSQITTYTFGVIEHDAIEGFRNVIVKESDEVIVAYLVHYPRGVDLEGHTPAEVYVEEIESHLGRDRERECYIMIFTCLWCGDQSCTLNQGWKLEPAPCPDEGGGGGGSGNDDPGDPWGGGDEPGLPTDPIPGGGGSSGDGNNNQTPCQALTQKSNETNFRNKINELRGKLNSPDENGYVNQNPSEIPGTNTSQTNQYNLMRSKTRADGLKMVDTSMDGPNVFGYMHTHPIHEKYMGVHSTMDIQSYVSLLRKRSGFNYSLTNTYCIVVGSHGVYALKLEDFSKFNNWTLEIDTREKYKQYFEKMEEIYYDIRKHENEKTKNERSILKILNMFYKNLGIGLYRAKDDLSGWERMTLDANEDPTYTNCN